MLVSLGAEKKKKKEVLGLTCRLQSSSVGEWLRRPWGKGLGIRQRELRVYDEKVDPWELRARSEGRRSGSGKCAGMETAGMGTLGLGVRYRQELAWTEWGEGKCFL